MQYEDKSDISRKAVSALHYGGAHEQARKWIISSMTGLPRSKTRRFPQIAEKWHPQRDSNPCCRDENPVS